MSELPITPVISVVEDIHPIGQLVAALAAAQLKYGSLVKTHINTYTGKKYADLSDVIFATQPALASQGLVVIQIPIRKDKEQEAGVRTILAHSSGEKMSVELILPATMKAKDGVTKFDQQSIGSAITYARRYTWQALVGISAEEDDDGNDATDQHDPRPTPPQPKTVKAPPISQKASSQGGERPSDTVKVTTVPCLPSEPIIITQSAPQTNDPAPVESSVVPKAVIPGPEPTSTSLESTSSQSEQPAQGEKPTKTQFDQFTNRVIALRPVLEKAGLKASKNLTVGAKLKNYLLASSGVKDLTELTVAQWNAFLSNMDTLTETNIAQAVTLIEGGKA